MSTAIPRREFLYGMGASLGALALTDLQAAEKKAANPLAPKQPLHKPKAKAVIMLFMEGGPSQVDTFDPKPSLSKLHLTESTRTKGLATGKRFYVGSPFKSHKVGNAGIEMCDQWKFLSDPKVADELCVYRGCKAASLNHPEALLHMNTGSRLGGDPGVGSWVNYGLGSENENLPGYVVMTELALPQAGPANWTNGFLPSHYQGTRLRSKGSPILDLNPPKYKSRAHQRQALDQLAMLNSQHAEAHPEHAELQARMESYELAYRMQMSVPGIIDLDSEPRHLQSAYGLDRKETAAFGRQCMLARRLVEEGVRFVQIFSGGWDSHDYLERGHSSRIASVDQPIAALIKDLKARGLLDETLVVWTGEFGRTPDNNYRGGVTALGRGHNIDAMNMWFAGGGVKRGATVGATDEIGAEAVEVVHPIRDVHVTMLHLLGLDDNKLTYFHGGRYKQLSQFGGELIPELMA
ncbi:MAG: DUF1501 domain-containing protein [Planctomycetes bacterium]|nr:DUF1501 domain-containing protein [Planctomycetota bacterium]MCH9727655.1 DUF1501 domain-containing protein [Planctomycetota bacterium]MCH9775080.1 DUF1501 domain-containing protein [Planctomycetota bacterium]MCH9789602.1 DUF1501 domain-containing protein [Planctomycetota bacterium]MDF1744216.1 DUF1501 domain-containing protein [Gimesia sp.]